MNEIVSNFIECYARGLTPDISRVGSVWVDPVQHVLTCPSNTFRSTSRWHLRSREEYCDVLESERSVWEAISSYGGSRYRATAWVERNIRENCTYYSGLRHFDNMFGLRRRRFRHWRKRRPSTRTNNNDNPARTHDHNCSRPRADFSSAPYFSNRNDQFGRTGRVRLHHGMGGSSSRSDAARRRRAFDRSFERANEGRLRWRLRHSRFSLEWTRPRDELHVSFPKQNLDSIDQLVHLLALGHVLLPVACGAIFLVTHYEVDSGRLC